MNTQQRSKITAAAPEQLAAYTAKQKAKLKLVPKI